MEELCDECGYRPCITEAFIGSKKESFCSWTCLLSKLIGLTPKTAYIAYEDDSPTRAIVTAYTDSIRTNLINDEFISGDRIISVRVFFGRVSLITIKAKEVKSDNS